MHITKKSFPSLRSTPRGCRMVRSDAAARAAISGDGLPPCCRQSHRSRRPQGHQSRHRRPRPHSAHADARLRVDARGRDGGVREELAAGVVQLKPETEVEATSILPSLNVKTARSWRGIVPFTHLAREGRMTVTIGRRELLAALGGTAVAWPLAARAQSKSAARVLKYVPHADLT